MSPSQKHGESFEAREQGSHQERLQQTERYLVEAIAALEHEVRTPLAVIIGYTSMLVRSHQHLSPEEQYEIFQLLQAAGSRLSLLADRLLELAQLEAGTFQLEQDLVEVSVLAREAMAMAKQQVPEHLQEQVTFHLHCRDAAGNQTEGIPAVKGDPRCLREVLEHLLNNAIRFSPSGGRIDIIVQPVAASRTAIGGAPSLGAPTFVEICVCDYGLGIAREHLERIFERFYRVDNSLTRETTGLGVGLTVCQYLVALHQGRLWAESCSAGGSAFHLWLPIEQASGGVASMI